MRQRGITAELNSPPFKNTNLVLKQCYKPQEKLSATENYAETNI
jgi:hypothetical protein